MFIVFLFHYRGGPVNSVVSVTSTCVSASDHLHLMWCILPCCTYENILLIINVLRIEVPLCFISSYLVLLPLPINMGYASDP